MQSRRNTILIVDDTPAALETLEGLLINQNYDLAFATNGAEALEKAATIIPDLVLLDVMMPGMDGFEVCRILRTYPQLAEVPIIMITALDDRESRLHGIEAGADDFLTKPFDRLELRARIQTIMRLNRYRRLMMERARFEWVVENADDGYVLVNARDEILYANARAQSYLSMSDDFSLPIGTTFLKLAQKYYYCQPQDAWFEWQHATQTELQRERYLLRTESATAPALWLLVTAMEYSMGPDTQRLIRLHDITAQMTTQRDMRTFHAIIHQKLSTSLWNMLLSVELLASRIQELSLVQLASLTDAALKGVKRLRGEIEDILHYLKAPTEAHKAENFAVNQLGTLVAQVSSGLELQSVHVSGHEQMEHVYLVLSERAVAWIVWELLENARKFHPHQSPTVEVVVSRAGSQTLSLQVMDDGITLPQEQIAHVWTPYYQGEKRFTGKVAGMGLGLPLVASLMWEVGGTCHLANRPDGPGVVVELIIPLH